MDVLDGPFVFEYKKQIFDDPMEHMNPLEGIPQPIRDHYIFVLLYKMLKDMSLRKGPLEKVRSHAHIKDTL